MLGIKNIICYQKEHEIVFDKFYLLYRINRLSKRNGFTFTHENFSYLMNRIDKDGNGIITKDEFLDEKFMLPSYRFASYSTMMTSQKLNNNSHQSPMFERTVSPGSFRNYDQNDQQVQFSFNSRLRPGEQFNQQRKSAPYQDSQYQGLQYGQVNNNHFAQQEYLQSRIQNLQQQQQSQQKYQNPEKISNSNKQPQNIPYDPNLQNSNPHKLVSSNSHQNDIQNDSLDHVNQVYTSGHSHNNLGSLSQKKIPY